MNRTAVVLINLGGPATQDDVEPFLANLFGDVLSFPWGNLGARSLGRLIARQRRPHAQALYRKIGGGSPILAETEAQARALQAALGEDYRVTCAMRYSAPTIGEVQARLAAEKAGWARIIALPLFPQYSFATTRSCSREWSANGHATDNALFSGSLFIGSYHDHPGYIAAQRELLSERLAGQPDAEDIHVVFSAHGVPRSFIRKGDLYQGQIEETARLTMAGLANPWSIAYQSRVGPVKWLGPDTITHIPALAAAGTSRVAVVPIAFVCEHLETLYELDMLIRDAALGAGIRDYLRVSAPRVQPRFIAALADIVRNAEKYALA